MQNDRLLLRDADGPDAIKCVIVLSILLAAVLVTSCGHSVDLKVTGSAAHIKLEYKDENGGQWIGSGVTIPWTYHCAAKDGDSVWLKATNETAAGDVTVQIIGDGETKATDTNANPYGIAQASWSIPAYVYPLFALQERDAPRSRQQSVCLAGCARKSKAD
jgi:hypothetical protein